MQKVTVAVWLCALTLSCSSDSASTSQTSDRRPAETSNELAFDAFLADYRDALCEYYERCVGYFPENECPLDTSLDWESLGVDETMLVFHPDEAEMCLEALHASLEVCEPLLQSSHACERTAEGSGQQGDVCLGEMWCGQELYCDTSAQCPGRCTPRAKAGEPCDVVPCARELECNRSVCVAPKLVGETCSVEAPCDSSLECEEGVCRTYKPYTSQLGEPCETMGDCFGINYCDPDTKKCVPLAQLGEACGEKPCDYQLRCVGSVCRAQVADGGECETYIDCEHLRCVDGTCGPQLGLGEACQESFDCRSYQCGTQGKCVASGSCE